MLIPKRTKYRKQHRPVRSGMSLRRAIDKLPMKCRIIAREGGDI